MARFLAGFAIGFASVWQLTLVTVAVVPLIAVAGGAYAVTLIGITSKSQQAYTKAGIIAEQVLHCFRQTSVLHLYASEFSFRLRN